MAAETLPLAPDGGGGVVDTLFDGKRWIASCRLCEWVTPARYRTKLICDAVAEAHAQKHNPI